MVAKYGLYSFELEPGNYTIKAEYYQNGTLNYSAEETVKIKDNGNYVVDLLLLPIYSKELMGSSEINGTSKNSSFYAGNSETEAAIRKMNSSSSMNTTGQTGLKFLTVNYLLKYLSIFFLLAASYLLFRIHKKGGKTSQEGKKGCVAKDFSKPVNSPNMSVKVHDKSIKTELKSDFQANTELTVYLTGQVIEAEPKIPVNEQVLENKIWKLDKNVQAEIRGEYPLKETEHDEKAKIISLGPKKELPLPADLQEVIDIIRGQGGRMTQKDLRSRLKKYSEGKVSLMLADLERRERIEKFKKGRGNTVILKSEES
jgi:uncharacterized membrane protein